MTYILYWVSAAFFISSGFYSVIRTNIELKRLKAEGEKLRELNNEAKLMNWQKEQLLKTMSADCFRLKE